MYLCNLGFLSEEGIFHQKSLNKSKNFGRFDLRHRIVTMI